jgi:DNA-binding CsgD family transcriptional regulator
VHQVFPYVAAFVALPMVVLDCETAQVPRAAGREGELRKGAALLEGIGQGPRSILVIGAVGIGKTTVWEALAEQAAGRGFRVLTARAAQNESSLAFAGLTDLLASIPDDAFDLLPAPQRSALRAAVLREMATSSRHDRRAVAAGTLTLIRAMSFDAPVLVAVDDQQWLDAPTARILEYVVRRLIDEPVAILASQRTESSSAEVTDLARGGRPAPSLVLELGRLDDATTERLVTGAAREAGNSLTMRQRHHLTELAAGNPLFARELARSPGAAHARSLPPTLRELVEDRIGRLPETTRSLLLLAATVRQPTVELVAAAQGCSADRAYLELEAAADAGVLTPLRGSRILFSHPLFRAGVRIATTTGMRRLAHVRAASVAVDTEEHAAHLALAATGPDAKLATRLDTAAARALARGAPEAATELAREALRLTPDADQEGAYRRAVTVAELSFHAGEIADARHTLEALVRQPAPRGLKARALRALGELEAHQDSHLDAIWRFSEALELDPDPDTRAHLLAHLAYSMISDGDYDSARRHALAALALGEDVANPARRATFYAVAAMTAYLMGEPVNEDLVRRALAAEDLHQPLMVALRPSLIVGYLRLGTGRLGEGIEVLTRVRDAAVSSGNETDLIIVSSVLTLAHSWAGQLTQARAYAEEALAVAERLDSAPGRAIAFAYSAGSYAFMGDLQQAETLAAEGLELAQATGYGEGRMWSSAALIITALEAGRPATATPLVNALLEVVDEHGLVTPVRVMALADAVEVLIGTSDLHRARHYQAVLEESAFRTETPWAQMQALRCGAMCTAATGDLDEAWLQISDALRFIDKHELALESARTRLVAGQIARRRRQRREAQTQVELALETFDAAGARTWSALCEAELKRTLRHSGDPGELTATEARVARMAADGLTNRDVAGLLNISPKTVEANLARAYRKLGIHSRAQLGAILGPGQRAREAGREP